MIYHINTNMWLSAPPYFVIVPWPYIQWAQSAISQMRGAIINYYIDSPHCNNILCNIHIYPRNHPIYHVQCDVGPFVSILYTLLQYAWCTIIMVWHISWHAIDICHIAIHIHIIHDALHCITKHCTIQYNCISIP